MKSLSQLLASFLLLISSFSLSAQNINFIAGFSSTNAVSTGDSLNNSGLNAIGGYHLGGSYDIKINDFLTFQPGLSFQTKGSKYQFSANPTGNFFGPRAAITVDITARYIDIPLNIRAHYDISKDLRIFASAGPYVGFGLQGEIATNINFLGIAVPTNQAIDWGTDLQRVDYGIGFGGGLSYQNITLQATYDLGLANLVVEGADNNSLKNRILRISLGYSIDLADATKFVKRNTSKLFGR